MGHPAPLVQPDEVARRLANYQRTKDPGSLWPGLTERERVAAARELERVARAVLAGEPRIPLDTLERHTPYALGVAGHTSGMGPLIGRWIEQDVLTATPATADVFAEHVINGRSRAARMLREVLPAVDALLARGITPIALKGFHTAHVYFDEPGLRPMSDVDLLVPASVIGDAEGALQDIGFRPTTPALRPYKRDWIGPGVDPRVFSVERSDARSKWGLELHASLDRLYHPGATARLDGERSRVEAFEIASRPIRVLAPPLLVVYLACHCSQELDSIRLMRVFELATIIRTESVAVRLQWQDVTTILEQTGAAEYTFPAFALVEDLAPGTVDPSLLGITRRSATPAARHTVDRLAPSGGSLDDRGILRQLMWTRGFVGVVQRFLRTLWPAGFDRPADVIPGWRVRIRRLRNGILSFRSPNERG
jgi:hypothetical protein